MSIILGAWEKQRIEYQKRYFETYIKFKECSDNHWSETSQMRYMGAIWEISWVLCNIFGLSSKQVEELERNKGFTNADIDSPYISQILRRGGR